MRKIAQLLTIAPYMLGPSPFIDITPVNNPPNKYFKHGRTYRKKVNMHHKRKAAKLRAKRNA